MNQSQIAKRWREHLVHKLQDRYGLTEEQAQAKADIWLQWVVVSVDKPQLHHLVSAEVMDERRPSRPQRIRSTRSKSAAATRV